MNLDRINQLPPCVCRVLARTSNGRHLLTLRELMDRSGLRYTAVQRLTQRTSWDKVTLKSFFAFTHACGVDMDRMWKSEAYLLKAQKIAWRNNSDVVVRALRKVIPPEKLVEFDEQRSAA